LLNSLYSTLKSFSNEVKITGVIIGVKLNSFSNEVKITGVIIGVIIDGIQCLLNTRVI
jgi:hypothetical protein